MIGLDKRRKSLGSATSAAIPLLWAALEKLGWSQAETSRQLVLDSATVAKLLYGERKAGRRLSMRLKERFGIPLESWDEPLPKGWRPHRPRTSQPPPSTRAA